MKLFLLLLHKYNFVTVTNWKYFSEIEVYQKGHDPQVENDL